MSYFGARLGSRPTAGTGGKESGSQGTGEQRDKGQEPKPYFAAQTGSRPTVLGDPTPRANNTEYQIPNTEYRISNIESPTCPLCRGTLLEEDGLYHCQGRCGARWLDAQRSPGQLVDLATLPFGVCACCERPQALVRGDKGAVCPVSGQAYLLLPDGTTLPADAAPHGICQCCVPPMPLAWQNGNLVCQARPDNRYRRAGDRVTLIASPGTSATPAETLAIIDAALRRNSARVTVNGLFDVG